MIRLILRLMALLVLCFSLFMAAGQAQPYEDDTLRTFLIAQGNCAAPCWEGIQPGVTTADQAIAILQAQHWVNQVVALGAPDYTNIYWQWNGLEPVLVNATSMRTPPYLHIRNGIVQYIHITTAIPYGDVQLLMDAPSSGTFTTDNPNSPDALFTHSAGYFGGSVVFDTHVFCPISPNVFWNAPVTITYSDDSVKSLTSMPPYDLAQWVYRDHCKS